MSINEIREIQGKKYEVIKTPCDCICHKQSGVMHIAACCNNGFIEHLTEIKTTMETTINANEVKKELYRTKVMAKFSHYTFGNLYYTIDAQNGIYQFPISTVEVIKNPIEEKDELMLSPDLGLTTFSAEMKASDLNRWVTKAIEKNEFIKIS